MYYYQHFYYVLLCIIMYNNYLGVTYWINDYLAVGHLMYDIVLLELVATVRFKLLVTIKVVL
jgi:hypothetical protein